MVKITNAKAKIANPIIALIIVFLAEASVSLSPAEVIHLNAPQTNIKITATTETAYNTLKIELKALPNFSSPEAPGILDTAGGGETVPIISSTEPAKTGKGVYSI